MRHALIRVRNLASLVLKPVEELADLVGTALEHLMKLLSGTHIAWATWAIKYGMVPMLIQRH